MIIDRGHETIFQGNGETFSAHYAAQEWLRENGYSYGSTCRNMPIAIKKGDYSIAKWKNLTNEERQDIDGKLYSGREGEAKIIWINRKLEIQHEDRTNKS